MNVYMIKYIDTTCSIGLGHFLTEDIAKKVLETTKYIDKENADRYVIQEVPVFDGFNTMLIEKYSSDNTAKYSFVT